MEASAAEAGIKRAPTVVDVSSVGELRRGGAFVLDDPANAATLDSALGETATAGAGVTGKAPPNKRIATPFQAGDVAVRTVGGKDTPVVITGIAPLKVNGEMHYTIEGTNETVPASQIKGTRRTVAQPIAQSSTSLPIYQGQMVEVVQKDGSTVNGTVVSANKEGTRVTVKTGRGKSVNVEASSVNPLHPEAYTVEQAAGTAPAAAAPVPTTGNQPPSAKPYGKSMTVEISDADGKKTTGRIVLRYGDDGVSYEMLFLPDGGGEPLTVKVNKDFATTKTVEEMVSYQFEPLGDIKITSSEDTTPPRRAGNQPAGGVAGGPERTEDASVPFMVTNAQKAQLRGRGYTESEIQAMRPSEVQGILSQPAAAAGPSSPRPPAPTTPVTKPPAPAPRVVGYTLGGKEILEGQPVQWKMGSESGKGTAVDTTTIKGREYVRVLGEDDAIVEIPSGKVGIDESAPQKAITPDLVAADKKLAATQKQEGQTIRERAQERPSVTAAKRSQSLLPHIDSILRFLETPEDRARRDSCALQRPGFLEQGTCRRLDGQHPQGAGQQRREGSHFRNGRFV